MNNKTVKYLGSGEQVYWLYTHKRYTKDNKHTDGSYKNIHFIERILGISEVPNMMPDSYVDLEGIITKPELYEGDLYDSLEETWASKREGHLIKRVLELTEKCEELQKDRESLSKSIESAKKEYIEVLADTMPYKLPYKVGDKMYYVFDNGDINTYYIHRIEIIINANNISVEFNGSSDEKPGSYYTDLTTLATMVNGVMENGRLHPTVEGAMKLSEERKLQYELKLEEEKAKKLEAAKKLLEEAGELKQ